MTWARSHLVAIATATLLFLMGIVIGASSNGTTETTTVTVASEATFDPSAGSDLNVSGSRTTYDTTVTLAGVRPAPAATIEGSGTFLVGTDIRPGLYRAAAAKSGNCYWERLRDLNGNGNSLITNDDTSGPVLLKVARTDFAVRTDGCATFTRVR